MIADSKQYSEVIIEHVPFPIQNKPKKIHKVPPLSLNLIHSSLNQSDPSPIFIKNSLAFQKEFSSSEMLSEEKFSGNSISKASLSSENNPSKYFDSDLEEGKLSESSESIKASKAGSLYSEESVNTSKCYPHNEQENVRDSLDHESLDSNVQSEFIDFKDPESNIKYILSKKNETNELQPIIDRP